MGTQMPVQQVINGVIHVEMPTATFLYWMELWFSNWNHNVVKTPFPAIFNLEAS